MQTIHHGLNTLVISLPLGLCSPYLCQNGLSLFIVLLLILSRLAHSLLGPPLNIFQKLSTKCYLLCEIFCGILSHLSQN